MTVVPLRAARVYRSEDAERSVHAWCRKALNQWPELGPLPPVETRLGSTQAFSAAGGPRTPVLVLSGTNFNAATTVSAARVLAEERPVYLVDLPGQPGLSCNRRSGSRIESYGAWLDEFLPQITDRPVIVLGHSRGAAIALSATPSPLVAGVALVNPAGLTAAGLTSESMRATLPWMIHPNEYTSGRMVEFLNGGPGTGPARSECEATAEWLTLVARHCRTGLTPSPLHAESLRAWADRSVMVATGSHDPFFSPARLHGPARRFLDTDVHVIEGAGHLSLHERPDRVAELLRGLDP